MRWTDGEDVGRRGIHSEGVKRKCSRNLQALEEMKRRLWERRREGEKCWKEVEHD